MSEEDFEDEHKLLSEEDLKEYTLHNVYDQIHYNQISAADVVKYLKYDSSRLRTFMTWGASSDQYSVEPYQPFLYAVVRHAVENDTSELLDYLLKEGITFLEPQYRHGGKMDIHATVYGTYPWSETVATFFAGLNLPTTSILYNACFLSTHNGGTADMTHAIKFMLENGLVDAENAVQVMNDNRENDNVIFLRKALGVSEKVRDVDFYKRQLDDRGGLDMKHMTKGVAYEMVKYLMTTDDFPAERYANRDWSLVKIATHFHLEAIPIALLTAYARVERYTTSWTCLPPIESDVKLMQENPHPVSGLTLREVVTKHLETIHPANDKKGARKEFLNRFGFERIYDSQG